MRATAFITVGIIAIVGLVGYWAVNTVHKTGEMVILEAQKMLETAMMGDYAVSGELLGEVRRIWDESKWKWELIIDHHELDQIQLSIARLEAMLEMENEDVVGDIAGLIYDVQHIMDKEMPYFENIF